MFRMAVKPAYVPAASRWREARSGERSRVTSVEPEIEGLHVCVLEIIGAYRVGAAPGSAPLEPVPRSDVGYISDGVPRRV